MHDKALNRGQLRYCPICDAYEASSQRIAVIGTGSRGLKEAEFLRAYSDQVRLVAPDGPHELRAADRDRLLGISVSLLDGPAAHFRLTAKNIAVACAAGECWFDTLYPALGP
jgi:thioredoxin reductase (NADPH)